jgi:Zn-finger nucleic acid-binding protein
VFCPIDNNQLVLIEKKNAFAYHCDDCDGVFLHRKAVAYFEYNYNVDILSHLENVDDEADAPLACPSCQTLMIIKKVNDLELDCCENCTGIWFEDCELEHFSIEDYAPQTKEEDAIVTIYWILKLIRAMMN